MTVSNFPVFERNEEMWCTYGFALPLTQYYSLRGAKHQVRCPSNLSPAFLTWAWRPLGGSKWTSSINVENGRWAKKVSQDKLGVAVSTSLSERLGLVFGTETSLRWYLLAFLTKQKIEWVRLKMNLMRLCQIPSWVSECFVVNLKGSKVSQHHLRKVRFGPLVRN